LAVILIVIFSKRQMAVKDLRIEQQRNTILRKDALVDQLKNDLSILQAYNNKEKEMIEEQITTIRNDHMKAKKAKDETYVRRAGEMPRERERREREREGMKGVGNEGGERARTKGARERE
jgi:hypothetical protein